MSSPRSVIFLLCFFSMTQIDCLGQFNEALSKEISDLNNNFKLDGFENNEALNLLYSISPDTDSDLVNQYAVGQSWKYSHSVSSDGRQYRLSNGELIYNFGADGNAYLIEKKTEVKAWCSWEYDSDGLLIVTRFDSQDKTKQVAKYYLGLHSISEDRLVLTKVIGSRESSGKGAILFNVYFRR